VEKGFKIIFMGTPDFAVPTLEGLHRSPHELLMVVTRPDRPRGRGRRSAPPPVKAAAQDLGYEVLQPDSVKSDDFYGRMADLTFDFFVIVAFGQIIPARVLEIPRQASVNVHASLLPRYRGPAPIQWAIINRESHTGVTTMFMDAGMDTGDILLQAQEPVLPDDTSETLHARLAGLGARTLLKTLAQFAAGTIETMEQDDSLATYAPMLKKADGRIDWNRPATQIEAFIRGVNPWPGAFTHLGQRQLKIFKAAVLPGRCDLPPGTVARGFSHELRVATLDGFLLLLEVQLESCKRLPIDQFLCGCQMPPGTILS